MCVRLRQRRRCGQLLALALVHEDLTVHLDVGVEADRARLGARQSETDGGEDGNSEEQETTTHGSTFLSLLVCTADFVDEN
jgi:hypothetical protein